MKKLNITDLARVTISQMLGNHGWICMVFGQTSSHVATDLSGEPSTLAIMHNHGESPSPLMADALMVLHYASQDGRDDIIYHPGDRHQEPLGSAAGLRCYEGHFISVVVDVSTLSKHTSYPISEVAAGIALYVATRLELLPLEVVQVIGEGNTYFAEVITLHL